MRISDWSSDVCSSDLSNTLTAAWEAEKAKLGDAQKLKEQLDQARLDLDQAQRKADWNRASELSYGVIPELAEKLKEAEKGGRGEARQIVRGEVTGHAIPALVCRWTGLPVPMMRAREKQERRRV